MRPCRRAVEDGARTAASITGLHHAPRFRQVNAKYQSRIGISRGIPRRTPAGYRVFRKLSPGDWFNSAGTCAPSASASTPDTATHRKMAEFRQIRLEFYDDTSYVHFVHGTPAMDARKERPMRFSIAIKFRAWRWRLSLHLSRR
jgi:hypothetical protein